MRYETSKLRTTLSSLLLDWWRVDRVRVSPREGLLLRLRPPCLITVATQRVQIEARQVLADSDVPTVIYNCQTEDGPAKLCIEALSQGSDIRVRWCQTGQTQDSACQELSPTDIEVYA